MKEYITNQNNKKVQLSKYDNSWYQPGSAFKRSLWMFANAIFFNNQFAVLNGLKCFILRLFGASVGQRVLIKPSVNIKYPWFLKVGNDVWIGENVWIDSLGLVTIGNNVCISQGALLLTGNHNYKTTAFNLIIDTIELEDGVWIGAKSTVCPGVICKSHSVLSVASVATTNLESFGIYQGVPAAKVRTRIIN